MTRQDDMTGLLRDALRDFRELADLCRNTPALQNQKYDGLGIRCLRSIERLDKLLSEVPGNLEHCIDIRKGNKPWTEGTILDYWNESNDAENDIIRAATLLHNATRERK